MSKQETIDRLKPLYFEGKSREAIEKFESKSIDKQYSALMSWNYRNRSRSERDNRGDEISDAVELVRAAIRSAKGASPEELERHRESIVSLQGELDSAIERSKAQLIAALERQQAEIQARLQSLMGGNQPY